MITVISASKRYGAVLALENVSLHVPQGSVTGVLGPNGSGKSTLFRVLLGTTPPDSGTVKIAGVEQTHRASRQRQAMVYVPDQDELYEELTPREYASLSWRFHTRVTGTREIAPRRRFEELAHLVGLTQHVDRVCSDLSHGTRRKAQLVAALVCQPDLLVIDEPTNGLDPDQHIILGEVLRQLAALGTTVLVSTHHLGFAEQVCDHVTLLRSRVIAEGSPAEVVARIGAANLAEAYERLAGVDREAVSRNVARALA